MIQTTGSTGPRWIEAVGWVTDRPEVRTMRLQVCRMVYEDAVGIGPEDVVSLKEAEKILRMKLWNISQLVDEGELTMLIDADAPKGWAWRWLLLRSEVEALATTRRARERDQGRSRPPASKPLRRA
jgi:hypothetical protein